MSRRSRRYSTHPDAYDILNKFNERSVIGRCLIIHEYGIDLDEVYSRALGPKNAAFFRDCDDLVRANLPPVDARIPYKVGTKVIHLIIPARVVYGPKIFPDNLAPSPDVLQFIVQAMHYDELCRQTIRMILDVGEAAGTTDQIRTVLPELCAVLGFGRNKRRSPLNGEIDNVLERTEPELWDAVATMTAVCEQVVFTGELEPDDRYWISAP